MTNVRFGRTGLKVSRLALGTMTFGLQTPEAEAFQILDKAAEAGINLLDSADIYPLGGTLQTVGETERILGRWFESGGLRSRSNFILATKAWAPVGANSWDQGCSRKHLLDAIDASLKRLRTDYIDLYQLHFDDRETPLEETLRALDDIVRSGRARYVGVSNFVAYRLARALGLSQCLSAVSFASVQPRYSLLFRDIERELLPLAEEVGLAVLPYNPLAGGLLTGKYRSSANLESNTRFTLGTAAEMYQQRYWNARTFATVDRIRDLAAQAGVPLTTLAIAWVLANPVVTSPLLGASRPAQLDDTLAAADYVLPGDLKRRLDDATEEYVNTPLVR
ncbi:MAG: aldo/keto reductase [Lautropia sp.]